MKKALFSALCLLVGTCSFEAPAKAVDMNDCTSSQGRSLGYAKSRMGEGKLISAMSNPYAGYTEMYRFGHYRGGACMVTVQGGYVEFATYSSF